MFFSQHLEGIQIVQDYKFNIEYFEFMYNDTPQMYTAFKTVPLYIQSLSNCGQLHWLCNPFPSCTVVHGAIFQLCDKNTVMIHIL